MKHTAKYISLEKVVYDYISASQQTEAQFLRLWNIAVRGLEEIGLSIGADSVTRKLAVMPNKTVELPPDYLDWYKIGILNDRGEIATLRHNHELTKYGSIDADRLVLNPAAEDTNDRDWWLYRNYSLESSFVNLYGLPSGPENLGEFTIDDREGFILLDKDFRYAEVYLEYRASPTHNSDYRMLTVMREVMIAWLSWQDISNLPAGRRANNGTIEQRKKEYFRAKRQHAKNINPIRLQDMNDAIRLGTKLAVKH